MVTRRFKQTCPVLNDALSGAIAEYHFGAGTGCQRLVYLTVSSGVGAGIILNGTPMTSPRGLVGHAGFMSSRHASQACGCGRIATVESVATGHAIAHAAELLGHMRLTAKEVFECHYGGQQWAKTLVGKNTSGQKH